MGVLFCRMIPIVSLYLEKMLWTRGVPALGAALVSKMVYFKEERDSIKNGLWGMKPEIHQKTKKRVFGIYDINLTNEKKNPVNVTE